MNDRKQRNLFNKMKNYHGKNVVIDYKPEFQFNEEWQTKESIDTLDAGNLLQTQGNMYIVYSILTMVLNVAGIWTISVERYFDTR